ncbi:UTP-glucose-1-phosphate uridylyltransferase [Hydrogenobacter thermophilus TK-6]|uniref:UTP--glucose-1-phosphate uridylyltransferase n=1 Tax=Hydrogenobacter thermophilus (strain DSM 6534 / IAM 12695 / TK-6) TaxID=608538 RepID=D3DGW0_HYDTT|nr:UTP--glucose-1-phosphate uridylyltransferase GalU [Hydrogenobacter thermophilus]ADO44997.1 UTP-glucose-1-phosphate uridylyltransferase [Hydrogenobacter thermophilus TK-6]BAI69062.1 UTP-glucose-1-phosphate uridylyltransferase [Hydrogenobacter thermophilus TK-6]
MQVRKAVLPVAGWGTRFLPATKAMPKEMFPIIDKPVIQFIVEECISADIENIIFVTGRHKRPIEHHFDINTDLEKHLEQCGKMDLLRNIMEISRLINPIYVRQKEQLGLGHAVLVAEPVVGYEPFVVALGDIIIKDERNVLERMIEVYNRFGKSVIAVFEVDLKDVSKYGIVDGRLIERDIYIVDHLIEKPKPEEAPSHLAIVGRYLFTPRIFEKLKITPPGKGGEIQLTDAIRLLIEDEAVYAIKIDAKVYDTGTPLGYIQTVLDFALQRDDIRDDLISYLRQLLSNNIPQIDTV